MDVKQAIYALALSLVLISSKAPAFDVFTIKDIRLEGLRRIAAGTVFNYLPLKVGDQLDPSKSSAAITALFKTGLFKDIRLERDGNVLIVRLEEQPAISKITFTGNSDIKTEDLTKALKDIGFAEGRVFNRSLLEKVEMEIQHQYYNLGKYAVRLTSTVTPLDRNRVGITIDVSEGAVARIRQITIVGNQAIGDAELLGQLELSTGGWFSWFSNSDQYSKQKLSADLETLRSYYLDRGYINFSIDSAQVSITPDRKDVYITINLTEGDKYSVSEVKMVGNLVVKESELRNKITFQPGGVYSRKEVNASLEAIAERIGEEGYAFPNLNVQPALDATHKTAALTVLVDPGKRIYIRRINFKGNTKTRDEVLRRELRQMEGGWYSTMNLKRSLTRLERLNYFDEVKVDTPRVPNTDDQVDVNFSVVEKPLGEIMAGAGYAQTEGFLLNASITQDNFLGTGNRVSATFNNSQVNTTYDFTYFNPYTTIDGISRSVRVFFRTTDAEQANLSSYTTDSYGTGLTYGVPITEFNNIRVGASFDDTKLKTTVSSAQEVHDFIMAHGDRYNTYNLNTSWVHDTRNRSTLLATQGTLQSLTAEIALPFSTLDYYKVSYRHQWLYPLSKDYTLSLEGQVGYGDGYGKTESLPFFENYTAGGPHSVRGFKDNTLGPLDSNFRPLGGNLKVVGNLELVIPVPFASNVNSVRLSAFFDIGNVYGIHENFEVSALRYSTGVSAIWLSPVGIFSFSLAKPLYKREGDQVQMFQFSIGTNFL